MNREENLCWFHGKISRERAEEILRQEGGDGVFMVRESTSSEGDFVLSVLFQDEVVHYQIRRHGDDAFFSIDDHTPIHGLDSLIEHYRESSNGLVTRLQAICRNDPPPHELRSHGTTNLLHRATKESNYTIVSELLKCGYRNIDSKNQDGQTAVHLACLYADARILEKLIERGSNINNRDAQGNTPLHYACRKQSGQEMVRLLIKAGANPQARNKETGWVPLHEAAANGNLENIRELLADRVPHMPRTSFGELPSDLAKENGHFALVEFFSSYEPPPPNTHKGHWYHGTLDRQVAVESLREHVKKLSLVSTGKENKENENGETDQQQDASGVYLVRYSAKHGVDVLTLLFNGEAKHFIIQRKQNYLYIDDGPYMISLEHLIEHYSRFSDGLQINLKYSVPPKPKPPIPLFSTIPKTKHKTPTSPEANSPPNARSNPAGNLSSSFFRKSSDNNIPKLPHPAAPVRNLSVPNDSMLQQMNKVGLFDRSPERTSTPKSQSNADENKSVSTNSTLKKKKNIIIDGMKSLRKSKIKPKPPADDCQLNRESLIAQISSSKILQQLSFSSDFSLSSNSLNSPGELYNTPSNNCAIVDIDIGEPTIPSNNRNIDNINNNGTVIGGSTQNTLGTRPSLDTSLDEATKPVDYFTESDKNIYDDDQLDNSNEEIYFIDVPPTLPAPNPPQIATVDNNNPPSKPATATNYIVTRNVPVFSSMSVEECTTPTSPSLVPPQAVRQGGAFERLDSTLSTMSRDSIQSGDSEFLSIIQQQQDEDERLHLRLNRSTSARPNYFIPKEYIVTQKVLGRGEFGYVYAGSLMPCHLEPGSDKPMFGNQEPAECIPIAVKQLVESQGKRNRADFLREASVMIRLRHHCIVKLIGICKGPPLMMIEELVPLGSMLDYIIANKSTLNPKHELIIWAAQIACGMQYLELHHFVHRDLAARNILLASRYQAKISDFGLSRAIGAGDDYYRASQGGKWPIKWYAPESFNYGTFSHASDVWSFGVTMWEMFSLGAPPYHDMKGVDVIKLIENNQRLSQPELCPSKVFEIMNSCWNYNPKNRPTFKFLTRFFTDDIEYQNLQEMVQSGKEINANQ
ncbi:tyrosine-protein kinase Shark isoform X2 [Toxorhynchites rutilus septentrionalis]|nr:tyrosine-protein kinase Shark isoform X2 [Toxorhynchites rutilus septentrionalis]XP_055623943.1 tyrosine-protein kinase Shark isoform X2 [Toxorhynchites rutilus septentrionalis]